MSKRGWTPSVRSFAIGYIIALGGAALTLAVLGYVNARSALATELDATMTSRMEELTAAYRDGGMPVLEQTVDHLSERSARNFGYLVLDATGQRRMGVTDLGRMPAPGFDIVSVYDRDDQRQEVARTLVRRLEDGVTLVVIADRDVVDKFDDALFRMSMLGAGIFLAVAIAGGIAIDRLIRKRLDPIAHTANAIIAGRLDQRVPVGHRYDEFDKIATVLNLMVDRLNALVLEVRRTSSFLAHDLRVPLMQLSQALAQEDGVATDPALCRALLASAHERSADLLTLFDAILRISRHGDGFFIKTTVNLSELTASLAESFALVAEEQGLTLDFEAIAPGIWIRADQHLINQLVVNLLDNSLRHGPPGGRITVSLDHADGLAWLTVANPAADAVHIRALPDPAHRAGFGLALIRAIVSAHEGAFTSEMAGDLFTVTVRLPVHQLGAATLHGPDAVPYEAVRSA